MIKLPCSIAAGFFLLFSGCGIVAPDRAGKDDTRPQLEFERTSAEPLAFHDQSVTGLSYAETPVGPEAWIFLVAGSRRGANFAQEIVEQRNMWLARGVSAEEIACYYVIPDKTNYEADATQYKALAAELANCRLAYYGAIKADLIAAAAVQKKSLYIYVTSHGDRPLSWYAQNAKTPEEGQKLNWLIRRYPELDRYLLATDAGPAGTTHNSGLLDAMDTGVAANDILLTPTSLKQALSAYADEVSKTVVMQGCYSGGFITAAETQPSADVLTTVPNITVLTAARNDRPSFGCGMGDEKTYFGSAVLTALAATAGQPGEIDWNQVYNSAAATVIELELKQGFKPSEPQYYSNRTVK